MRRDMRVAGSLVDTRSLRGRLLPWIVGVAWWVGLVWAWNIREERYFSAGVGLGYGFGVLGLSLMCLMLIYSVRKRMLSSWSLGAPRRWLSVHMFLGLFGPFCILLHANFRLGSFNSTVALVCMILVAASGVFGRFLYPRIHTGLMGQKAILSDLQLELDASKEQLGDALAHNARLENALREGEDLALSEGNMPILLTRAVALRRRHAAVGDRAVESYFRTLHDVLRFRIYERCFSLWHAFHLPLCFLLFGAAIVHVVAVHLY